jgi:heat shock protein HtpX
MSNYVGIQSQITRNNRMSVVFLLAFPALILATVYAFLLFIGQDEEGVNFDAVNDLFVNAVPFVIFVTGAWFAIAYWMHGAMISAATGSKTLSRKDNMRVYNLIENLCMSQGMTMPKVNIIEDPALNAFASGLNEKSYTVTLTRGIINELNDEELEGVIAHELMHIKNKDVRLLVISIIFVGIFSFLVQVLFRSFLYGGHSRKKNKQDGKLVIVALVIAAVAYFLSLLFKFGLSRKREYMADAGAADMTKKPWALASALRKISGNHEVNSVKGEDVKEMFIYYKPEASAGISSMLSGLFATHPPIKKRIDVLENF